MRELMRGNIQNQMLLGSSGLRSSFRTIGRTLGVDQGTVRNRIRKLKHSGVIRGWRIEVNPILFRRKLECVNFDVAQGYDKREVIEEIHSIDDVALICNYLGTGLFVMISGDNETSLRETGRKIAGIAGRREFVWKWRPTALPQTKLTRTDWEIIKSLQSDPWKPYEQIAREVHLSAKTTTKRVTILAREGAIQLSIDVNMSGLIGIVPGSLWIFYVSPTDRGKVVKLITDYLGDQLFFASVDDRYAGYFALALPNAARLEEIVEWVKKQPGVKNSRGLILLDVIPGKTMIKQEAEKRIMAELRSGNQS